MAPRPMSAQPASKSDSACKQSGLNPGSLLLQPGVIKEGKPLIHPVNKSVNLRSEVESARIQHGYSTDTGRGRGRYFSSTCTKDPSARYGSRVIPGA